MARRLLIGRLIEPRSLANELANQSSRQAFPASQFQPHVLEPLQHPSTSYGLWEGPGRL